MAMFFNKIHLAGVVTADAKKMDKFTKFRLLYENPRKAKKPEKLYIDVKTFGTLSATVAEHVKKGMNVIVVGRLVSDEYEKDGKRHYFDYIIADEVQFLPGAKKKVEEEAEPVTENENGATW